MQATCSTAAQSSTQSESPRAASGRLESFEKTCMGLGKASQVLRKSCELINFTKPKVSYSVVGLDSILDLPCFYHEVSVAKRTQLKPIVHSNVAQRRRRWNLTRTKIDTAPQPKPSSQLKWHWLLSCSIWLQDATYGSVWRWCASMSI